MAMSNSRASRLLSRASARVLPSMAGDADDRGLINNAIKIASRGLEVTAGGRRRSPGDRSPLTPAAVRVERSRGKGRAGKAHHTAVTLWFGEGPGLPSGLSTGSPSLRTAARIGAGALMAAALAAATAMASRADTPRIVDTVGVPVPDMGDTDEGSTG